MPLALLNNNSIPHFGKGERESSLYSIQILPSLSTRMHIADLEFCFQLEATLSSSGKSAKLKSPAASNYLLLFDAAISPGIIHRYFAEDRLAGLKISKYGGFDEKKLDMGGEYCKHLLDAAKVHLEATEARGGSSGRCG